MRKKIKDWWLGWFRGTIIERVAAAHADVCWADLVLWAIFPEDHPFSEIYHMRHTCNYCGYCGKVAPMLFYPAEKVRWP